MAGFSASAAIGRHVPDRTLPCALALYQPSTVRQVYNLPREPIDFVLGRIVRVALKGTAHLFPNVLTAQLPLGGVRAGSDMVQRVTPVAFEGHRDSDRRRPGAVAPGMPAFTIVGPPDKAAFEARERVRSAMIASGLAFAARRITINLALMVGPPGAGKSMLASRLPDPAAAGRPNSSKSPWSPPSPVSFEGSALTHRFSLLREAANAMRLSARG